MVVLPGRSRLEPSLFTDTKNQAGASCVRPAGVSLDSRRLLLLRARAIATRWCSSHSNDLEGANHEHGNARLWQSAHS
jgi:hypothetical protein